MTEETMAAAKAALVANGFVANDDGTVYTKYRNKGTVERTRYEVVDGGFHRFFKGEQAEHSLLPKGDPAWDGLPPGARNGVSASEYPKFFQWVWPAEDILKIYGGTSA